jgi:exoribonuclease II
VDRAISIRRTLRGLRVALHFASPALLDDPVGLLEATSRERASSVHLPEKIIPMLPAAVGSRCRLVAHEWRPALTVAFTLTRDHCVRRAQVLLRRVRVQRLIDWDAALDDLFRSAHWRRLHETAQFLRAQRRDRGAITLSASRAEPRVRDGVVELEIRDPEAPVRQIVEELTILAHTTVGLVCAENSIPTAYRVAPEAQRPPEQGNRRLNTFAQGELLTRARLQVDPAPHHVVAAAQYVTVSQPLHRYTDFLVHRQLLAWLTRPDDQASTEQVQAALEQTAWSREAIRDVENSGRRYWLLRYLEQHDGVALSATVLELRGRSYWVELDECGVRGSVDSGGEINARAGDRINVKVSQVSARRDLLRLRR